MRKPEFIVEISRPGELGLLTSATLELPATWAEYQDASPPFNPLSPSERDTPLRAAGSISHWNG